tara:strand:- start:14214 stop:14888 length:675 start_codon:yes stop_codon:yes gene_type:complete
MTLEELKTLIQNFTENEETTFVNTLNDFIINAEERLFHLIQLDFFRKNVTGNLTTGNTYLTAPSDFQMSFSLAVIDGNGDYHYLDKKHTSFMREFSPDPTATSERGRPKYYGDFDKELSTGSDNGSTLIVAPVPDQDYNVELHYLYEPLSLTSQTSGTWISQNARNALLYGCLVEAYTFMKGEQDMMALYENRFNQEVSRLKNLAEARGRQDEYRYDSLRTQVS